MNITTQQIIDLYENGNYSYDDIANKLNVYVGDVIRTVNNYLNMLHKN
jgi:transposase